MFFIIMSPRVHILQALRLIRRAENSLSMYAIAPMTKASSLVHYIIKNEFACFAALAAGEAAANNPVPMRISSALTSSASGAMQAQP